MPKLSRKIELFTESVIARMSRIAEASGAINLAEGCLLYTSDAADE